MDTNKMRNYVRDEFLEWMVEECERRGECYTTCTTRDRFDRYELVWVQTSWIAWQASRAAVAVELPAFDGYQDHIVRELQEAFIAAIEAQGLKVAP